MKYLLLFIVTSLCFAQNSPTPEDKIYGMLLGSVIGDAAGGPVEFVDPPLQSIWTSKDKKLSAEGIKVLGDSFKIRDYSKKAEPFAQWEDYAKAGTITDDSRFKIILFNTLKHHKGELTEKNFAQEVIDFRKRLPGKYQSWFDKWIPEIAFATKWVLGERENAYPPSRIWGGIPTMEGQMPFLPIAALNPMDSEWCYLKTWELGYFDIGIAKDMNSALVAGLARALQNDGNWQNAQQAMIDTDPYNFNNVLYVKRRLTHWLEKAHEFADRADGVPAKLFTILENELNTYTWWESWVPIVVVFAVAELTDYDPLSSMQLILEFGHDTDSYAQVMGAFMGAIHGKEIFPKEMRDLVNKKMKEQFEQNVDDWMELIHKYKQ